MASDYPLLDIFWTMLWFFLFFIWIWLLIIVFMDIFRSRDMGGGAKALWVIFIILIPLLGVLVYLIARGGKMHEHSVEAAQAQQAAFNDAVRQAAGSGNTAEDLAKLADLKDKGVITQAEFDAQKAKILAS